MSLLYLFRFLKRVWRWGRPVVLVISASRSLLAQETRNAPAPEAIVVRAAALDEESLIGENRQPEWTGYRRFPTTRVYVLPPWQIEFEQWWKGKFPRERKPEHLFQSEVEIGLPYRFQLDVYENVENTASGKTRHAGNQVEARWALADWGRIPLNPTLYAEWKFNSRAADAYEIKFLLGEQLAPKWHWGLNLFYEQETGGGRTTEWGISQAVGYSALDKQLSVGIEMNFEHTTERRSRGEPEIEFLIGPSVQWRPTSRTHLDIVPLLGATHDSPRVEAFIVFGVQFGGGSANKEAQAPLSTGSR